MKYLGLLLALAIGIPMGILFIRLEHPIVAAIVVACISIVGGISDARVKGR